MSTGPKGDEELLTYERMCQWAEEGGKSYLGRSHGLDIFLVDYAAGGEEKLKLVGVELPEEGELTGDYRIAFERELEGGEPEKLAEIEVNNYVRCRRG